MSILADATSNPQMVLLFLAVGLALAFEFVNGFHDTANAVATVIYTHSLPPYVAVIWSGICNLTGVLLSTGAVAFSIVALLPVELVLNVGSGAGFAMVFSLLVSAIIWNVGTWYLGLPASSTHTLVGAILGVGLANALISGHSWTEGVNWHEAYKVGLSLLVSPVVGFGLSAILVLILKAFSNPALFTAPEKDKGPPSWIRGILILTCTGVSYAHGRNDGQKGMGLIVLILVGLLPVGYALKMDESADKIQNIVSQAQVTQTIFAKGANGATITPTEVKTELEAYVATGGQLTPKTYAALALQSQTIHDTLNNVKSFGEVAPEKRTELRKTIYLQNSSIGKLAGSMKDASDKEAVTGLAKQLTAVTNYIPTWVKFAVAFALGLGTMVGWKRIVVTVGEKIGKSHLTYGQGASAELVAMATILAADNYGMPVSTTHVLSSGVAGTMAANRSGLQAQTLRNILMAWVLTLPVCMVLGSALFAFANNILLSWLGLK